MKTLIAAVWLISLLAPFRSYSMNMHQALTMPDIIKLFAYTLVDDSKAKPISQDSVKALLKPISRFARTNKKIQGILHKLIYGSNDDAKMFNNHLITHFSRLCKNECLSAAYLATPCALQVVKRYFDKSKNLDEFKIALGAYYAKHLCSASELPLCSREHNPFLTYIKVTHISGYYIEKLKPSSFDELLKAFPSVTRDFCNKLITESSQSLAEVVSKEHA